ncbi:hypothetical protein [Leptospira kmetyi]|uniref:Mrr-like domain-containing protein n=1 Tax=Leptospira kmetyi TaxID=408139 RepID=A0ABX4N8C4_9LEPT|nr:hypothetical protein [Leptospira kmetyi]PJZ28394.1 hypothetical protein CH378_18125 [Leptospira kmetyi]
MLPFSTLTPQSFEQLIRDIYNVKEETNTYSIFGRHGQAQTGIDVFSSATETAIQCKLLSEPHKLRKEKIQDLIKQEVTKLALSKMKVKTYIFATTFPHDVDLISYCRILKYQMFISEKIAVDFEILFLGWNEISSWAIRIPQIMKMYFSDLILKPMQLEIVKLRIIESECSWRESKTDTCSFNHVDVDPKSDFPTFDIIILNNSDSTQILDGIDVFSEELYSGLHGFSDTGSGYLEFLDSVSIEIKANKDWNAFNFDRPIYIVPNAPLRLKTLLYEVDLHGNGTFFTGLRKLQFRFKFLNAENLLSDFIYFNCSPTIPKIQTFFVE